MVMTTHFNLFLANRWQRRDRGWIVVNENAETLFDSASFDGVCRLSQVRVDYLQQRHVVINRNSSFKWSTRA